MTRDGNARVAITAAGLVAPGAIGSEAFVSLLRSGSSAIEKVDRFDTSDSSAHCAAVVRNFNVREFIAPMKARRMSNLSRFGVAAAKLALDARGRLDVPGERVGVAMGSSFGPVQTSVEYLEEYVSRGAALAPPQLFAESVANAPGSHIAIESGFRGFNVTFTQRESSFMTAAMYASSQIVKGTVDAALAGGAEELNEMVFTVLDRIGALAHATDDVNEAARPFDRRRNGIVFGEGSGVFVLEREGAGDPWAFFSGFGIAKDARAPISDWGADPAPVAEAMRMALVDAAIEPGEIDVIFASANSSVRGDRLEYRAIETLFGHTAPPVVATKGFFGEYAAAGALQVATAVIAVRDQWLPASVGFEEGEPEMTLEIAKEGERPIRHALVNSLSAGGGVVSVVVSRRDA